MLSECSLCARGPPGVLFAGLLLSGCSLSSTLLARTAQLPRFVRSVEKPASTSRPTRGNAGVHLPSVRGTASTERGNKGVQLPGVHGTASASQPKRENAGVQPLNRTTRACTFRPCTALGNDRSQKSAEVWERRCHLPCVRWAAAKRRPAGAHLPNGGTRASATRACPRIGQSVSTFRV